MQGLPDSSEAECDRPGADDDATRLAWFSGCAEGPPGAVEQGSGQADDKGPEEGPKGEVGRPEQGMRLVEPQCRGTGAAEREQSQTESVSAVDRINSPSSGPQ